MRNFWTCCLVLVACRLLAAWVFPSFDDAFITYRYSQNLAEGKGLVYNEGENILGTTTPAFAIVASVPFLLGVDAQIFFLFFNIACDLCALYLAYKYIFKDHLTAFIVFAALFSIAPIINRVSVGGMEVNLFLLLSLTGTVLYLQAKKMAAFMLLAAIYFVRPEAVILLGILLVHDWYVERRLPWKYGLAAALVMIIPTIFIYNNYGHALPHSVVAKSNMHHETWGNLAKWTLFADPMFYLITPLGIIGMMQRNRLLVILALWALLYTLAYFVGRPPMYTWYGYSIQFVLLLFAAFIISKIPITRYVLPAAAVIMWAAIAFYKGRSGVEKYVYHELKNDFRSDADIKSKIIYADDIGAIGYFTGAKIYDGLALVTPAALHHNTQTGKMRDANADYLFIYADARFLNMVANDSFLSKNYVFQKRYSLHGHSQLPSKDSSGDWTYAQDYLLFKKAEIWKK